MSDWIPGDMIKDPSCTNSLEAPCYAKIRKIKYLRDGLDLPKEYTDDQVLLFADTFLGSVLLCKLAFSDLWVEIRSELSSVGDKINKFARMIVCMKK